MKKADMEAHRDKYQTLMSEALSAERDGLYTQTVELAISSWDYIDGMMQYERKYNDSEFASIRGIDMILKYAPLLLDFTNLDKLKDLLKNFRRIEKNTSDSLDDRLSQARSRMWISHQLWNHIEQNPETRQSKLRQTLGGDQNQWRSIADAWEKMGLLRRTQEDGSCRLALTTRMGELIQGKCSSCGEVVEAPKAMFLEKTACPNCRKIVFFVILSPKTESSTKE